MLLFENEIKDKLESKNLIQINSGLSGCINTATVYETDSGEKIFVKFNQANDSAVMFDGELASLTALAQTNTIRVPKPKFTIDLTNRDKGAVIVMEYIDKMVGLSKHQDQCGQKLGQLHLDNINLEKREKKLENWVGKGEPERRSVNEFGFDTVTCCGKIALVNDWHPDWVSFYARNRLDMQIRMVQEECNNREIGELWSKLQLIIPKFFKPFDEKGSCSIRPSLLHGDLWSGNAGETDEEPIIFDPASFYGHNEFELSISDMFGGFRKKFFDAYHQVIKKSVGYEERKELYKLFHYLNHWNHFGGGYAKQSLDIMEKLTK